MLQQTTDHWQESVKDYRYFRPPFGRHLSKPQSTLLVSALLSRRGWSTPVALICNLTNTLRLISQCHLNDCCVFFSSSGAGSFSRCLPVQLEHLHPLPECWMSANCCNEAISLWGWAVLNKQEQQGRVLHWAICGSTLAKSAAVFTTLMAGRRTQMTFS